MKEKHSKSRSKTRKDKKSVKYNKKRVSILLILILIIVGTGIFFAAKLNNGKSIACAKSRDNLLKGVTVTDIINNEASEIEKGPSKSYGKVAFITIDDGPSEYTDKIVKILNNNNAHATFFMINANMKAFPQQVKNALDNGNSIGLHSVSHDIHKLYATTNSAKKEFDINEATFKSITGKDTDLVRLPFGSKPYTPKGTYDSLMDAGYRLWDWTLDTEDWRSTSPQILSTVKKYADQTDNMILLIHEKPQTVAVLDKIVKYLKSQGFEILPIKESDGQRNYWNGQL